MNSFAVVAFFTCLAAVNAGVYHHGSSAKILQGPSSRTTVVGPEGSVISAVAPGGQIIHEEHPGVVADASPVAYAHALPVVSYASPAVSYTSHSYAHQAPVASPVLSYASPAVAYTSHAYAHEAPVSHIVAHAAPVSAYAAPSTVVAHSSAYGQDNVVVAGPSGTIATGKSVHSVPVVAHASPVVAHHVAPVVAHAAPILAYGAAHGYEGQYVHDHSETLYDDGSYKPHVYHH